VNKPIGYWLKRLDAALEAHLDRTLARVRLSRRQWQTLNTLAEGPIRPEDLDERLEPFWAGDRRLREREVGALIGHGYVGMLDGNIILSEDGHRKHLEALRLVEEARKDLTAGIGHDEYAIAVGVLERMCANAERVGW
jgi:DNA-binding MarR family transcriptional regulator